MERVEKSFEIDVPVHVAYNQWTQFEEFPRFMEGVEEVRQTDDTHLHWRASIAGKQKEWDAEITEQVPDRIIAWTSISGAPNAGAVRFEPIGDGRTRVDLSMQYEPETAVEQAGDAIGLVSRKVEKTIEDFKSFLEERGRETGAWRGEVHGGQETSAPGGQSGSSTGLSGSQAAGNPASTGSTPGAAGGAFAGSTGGTPGAGGGKAGLTPDSRDPTRQG
jgi:carbon monoxide dehydrogenase subunit G